MGNSQMDIDKLNSQISYKDGKITWEPNKGWTSHTMKYLYQCGYRTTTSGIIHTLYDMEGKKVTSAYSWIGLLFETAKIMA